MMGEDVLVSHVRYIQFTTLILFVFRYSVLRCLIVGIANEAVGKEYRVANGGGAVVQV